MINSMTAFASRTGHHDHLSWTWDIRGVNARGLDLRLRIPDGLPGLEQNLRALLSEKLQRGNVSLTLRLNREEKTAAVSVDTQQLDAVLSALDQVQDRAFEMGVTLGQPTAADVLAQRGVLVAARDDEDGASLAKQLTSDFENVLADFVKMREAEGTSLHQVLAGQLDQIDKLTSAAAEAASARRTEMQAQLTSALQRVIDDVAEMDEARVAQELAMIAIKSDVTEEIDRLQTHVGAARDLLNSGGGIGRRFDFLAQEFNREANTLCAKAQSSALTAIGLDLKAVIDQMREQVQNVE